MPKVNRIIHEAPADALYKLSLAMRRILKMNAADCSGKYRVTMTVLHKN